MKRLLFLIVALGILYGSSYLAVNWDYLPFIYKGFGRNFNTERIKIGQPIIEDYFIPRFENGKRRQIWLTPDSLKSLKLHRAKNYNTEKGEIVFETDFFVLETDSLHYVLVRSYHYQKKYVKLELRKKVGNRVIAQDDIDRPTYDSLIASW